jgi:hypothetical protein
MVSLEFLYRHLDLPGKTRIMSTQPFFNISAEFFRQRYHFFGFLFSDQSSSFIIADITFFTELVQLLDCSGVCSNGEGQ